MFQRRCQDPAGRTNHKHAPAATLQRFLDCPYLPCVMLQMFRWIYKQIFQLHIFSKTWIPPGWVEHPPYQFFVSQRVQLGHHPGINPVVHRADLVSIIDSRSDPRPHSVYPPKQRRAPVEQSCKCLRALSGEPSKYPHDTTERGNEFEAKHDMEEQLPVCPGRILTALIPALFG